MTEKAVETRRKEKENLEKEIIVALMCQMLELDIIINILVDEPKNLTNKASQKIYLFLSLYRTSSIILYYDQQIHKHFTDFYTIVSFSDSL